MPTQPYYTKDGKRVPGVTTVLNQLGWKTEPLKYWAWKVGSEGRTLDEAQGSAMEAGTIVHACIEADIKGRWWGSAIPAGIETETADQVGRAMSGYLKWREGFRVEPTGSEVSLVSERHRFGGTIDIPALVNGERCIFDIKAARSVYDDYKVQVRGYGELWNENYPDDSIDGGGYHILRTGKESGEFEHHWYPDLDLAWEVFLHARALYELHKEMKRRR